MERCEIPWKYKNPIPWNVEALKDAERWREGSIPRSLDWIFKDAPDPDVEKAVMEIVRKIRWAFLPSVREDNHQLWRMLYQIAAIDYIHHMLAHSFRLETLPPITMKRVHWETHVSFYEAPCEYRAFMNGMEVGRIPYLLRLLPDGKKLLILLTFQGRGHDKRWLRELPFKELEAQGYLLFMGAPHQNFYLSSIHTTSPSRLPFAFYEQRFQGPMSFVLTLPLNADHYYQMLYGIFYPHEIRKAVRESPLPLSPSLVEKSLYKLEIKPRKPSYISVLAS
ncbi:MAG: hypothetical protein GXN92_01370 [Candidatus Micrarchaeota archaeon]|nr:hypothetical protein [Candidatus Micrarchaeota archaeon]